MCAAAAAAARHAAAAAAAALPPRADPTSCPLCLFLTQQVDNYEYEMPSDFEDEDIDDEMAFTGGQHGRLAWQSAAACCWRQQFGLDCPSRRHSPAHRLTRPAEEDKKTLGLMFDDDYQGGGAAAAAAARGRGGSDSEGGLLSSGESDGDEDEDEEDYDDGEEEDEEEEGAGRQRLPADELDALFGEVRRRGARL